MLLHTLLMLPGPLLSGVTACPHEYTSQYSSSSAWQILKFKSNLKLTKLTSWFMEPGGSMPYLQGLSNNPYPKSNQSSLFVRHESELCPSIQT